MKEKVLRFKRLSLYFAPSLVTFLLGTGSLILVDIILSRYAADADLKDWVLLKSIMLPLATLALLGVDQVIVREPSKLNLFIRPALLLAAAITLIAVARHVCNRILYSAGDIVLNILRHRGNAYFLRHVSRNNVFQFRAICP